MQRGIVLCCWLGVVACSPETPGSEQVVSDSEDDEYTEPAPSGAGEMPTATVMVEGETYEVSGNGSCQLIGSRRWDDPEGVLEIQIKTLNEERYVQVLRGRQTGLLIAFHKTDAPLRSWSDGFVPEDDTSEFDGRRFTFEGTVVSAPDLSQRIHMRMEVDCPSVEDVTTE